MQYYNLKFIGMDTSMQFAYGNIIMCDTDFVAYCSEVHNFFSSGIVPCYIYIGNGHMMKYENENAFWKNLEIACLTEDAYITLKALGLDNYGSFPDIECFIKKED